MQQLGIFGGSVRWSHDPGPPGPGAVDGDAWHRAATANSCPAVMVYRLFRHT
jgi:hypothetical protein